MAPQADVLRQAGDAFRAAGDITRALLFYDAAIDVYLHANDAAAAGELCEAIVDLAPTGVRPRCTLAWLAVLLAPPSIAARRIAQYAQAAEDAGVAERACRQLRCMAEECDQHIVLEVIADALLHLGDAHSANRVYGRIYERNVPARLYASPADHARVVAARLTMALTT
jgi:hypothetical protein